MFLSGDRSENFAGVTNPYGYCGDMMFRSERLGSEQKDSFPQAEGGRILANALGQSQMSAAEYLNNLVSAKTGLTESEAETRVSRVITDARLSEDTARTTTAHFLLWLFLALSAGVFSPSYYATVGGRQRDHLKAL
jgi:hypothetical protein